jgi:hypothetical protein
MDTSSTHGRIGRKLILKESAKIVIDSYHTQGSTKRAGGKWYAKLGTNHAGVPMHTGDLTPDLASLASLLIGFASAIDKGNALTKVPSGLLCTIHVL